MKTSRMLCILIMFTSGFLAAQTAAGQDSFMLGSDLSMLEAMEKQGVRFKDSSGTEKDAINLFMENGWKWFRIRLFVNPSDNGGAIQDLAYVLRYCGRVKRAGGKILLDLHYSDTWADPAHQTTPAAWQSMNAAALEQQIETYTRDVLAALRSNNTMPDMVQVGNEITPGMLWPLGRNKNAEGWAQFARFLAAGIRGLETGSGSDRPRVMIHIDRGGSAQGTKWFFDELTKTKIPWDITGLSFYPWWHGTLSNLKETLSTAARYGKPIVMVETAYPWRDPERFPKAEEKRNLEYPITPEGQMRFFSDLIDAVHATPRGLGLGVFVWAPEYIRTKWYGGANAFFDSEGKALPVLKPYP